MEAASLRAHQLGRRLDACPRATTADDGRGSRVCGFEAHGRSYDDKGYDFDNPRINMGYEIARSMRFEPSQGGR